MFQNSTNKSIPSKNNSSSANKNSFQPKNLFIHTMKKDLKNLSNPNFNISKGYSPSNTNVPAKPTQDSASKEKTSPFLSQKNWDQKEVWSEKERGKEKTIPSKLSTNTWQKNKKIALKEETHGTKKVLVAIIIIFIFLAVGLGGYYFWKTRLNNTPKTAMPIPSETPAPAQSQTSPEQDTFSVDKPNYLSVDIKNVDKTGLEKNLQDYVNKVSQTKITSPLEFTVTDTQNNPVTFQVFAQKLGLTLPQSILSQLGPTFSLYIYNDNKDTRLGLASPVQNSQQVKKILFAQEKNLPKDLKALFLSTKYTAKTIAFNDGNYNGVAIRYYNIISPEILSLDYAFYQNQLLIGTTKMTLHSIIDSLQQTTPSSSS